MSKNEFRKYIDIDTFADANKILTIMKEGKLVIVKRETKRKKLFE